MDWLSLIPAALTLFGSHKQKQGYDASADAVQVQARLQQQADEFTAQQLEQRGGQAVAISQKQAAADRLQTQLITSRQLAVAAASGGGASDPTIINLIAKTAGVGAYKSAIDLYQGEEESRQLKLQAAGKRYEGALGVVAGDAKASAYRTSGDASLLAGAGSLFSKYGMGGINATTSTDNVTIGASDSAISWD